MKEMPSYIYIYIYISVHVQTINDNTIHMININPKPFHVYFANSESRSVSPVQYRNYYKIMYIIDTKIQ